VGMDFQDVPAEGDGYTYGPASYVFRTDKWKRGTGTVTAQPITITELIPATMEIGDADTPCRINGTGFSPSTLVVWEGVDIQPVFVSATHIRVLVALSGTQVARTVQVTAKNGTTVATPSLPFVYTDATPDITVTQIIPPTGEIGDPDLLVRVLGTNFNVDCRVGWEFAGYTIATTYIGPTELNCSVAMVGRPRTVDVWVRDIAIGKNSINSLPFQYLDQVTLKLTSLVPAQGTIGQPPLTVRVLGEQFLASSMVTWEGADVATTYVSPSELEVSVPMTGLPRTVQVSVHNGALVSNALPFVYNEDTGVLTIVQLIPPEVTIPNTVTVSIQGTGFNPPGHANESSVYWAGGVRASTYVSSIELRVTIDSTGETEREVQVYVTNIGGAVSNPVEFQYNNPPLQPNLTLMQPDALQQGGLYDHDITIYGTNFQAMSVASFNGVDVADDKTVFMSPTALKITIRTPVTDADDSVPITVRNDTLVSNILWLWCTDQVGEK
jgi:IPT/TIG domain